MISSFKIIKVGEHGEVPGPEVFWMKDFDKWYKLSFYSFLIGTSDGYVLINTGLPDDLSLRNKFLREWAGSDRCKFSHVYKIEDALGKLGITPDDISHVIISPVQDYSIGRINLFKKAKLYFSKTGWFHDVVLPSPSPFLNRDIYLPRYVREYLFEEAWDRIVLVENEKVVDEIEVKWQGCHHRSSMMIKFLFQGKEVCISDSAFLEENVTQNIPIGIAEDIYECLNAYQEMRKECNIIIPAYDPRNVEKFKEYLLE